MGSPLDGQVSNVVRLRPHEPTAEKTVPWEQPVIAAKLLNEIMLEIQKFVHCSDEVATAATLWITATWNIALTEIAPVCVISAPESGCGKTQMLKLFNCLVKNPLFTGGGTVAYLMRKIELEQPTLLVDEFDTIKGGEELRALFNTGFEANGVFGRCEGVNNKPVEYRTFCFKAIAGIGKPHITISSRAIPLNLQKMATGEQVARMRQRDTSHLFVTRRKLAKLAEQFAVLGDQVCWNGSNLVPDALSDRESDCWELMLGIANEASPEWLKLAQSAAIKIHKSEADAQLKSNFINDIKTVLERKKVSSFTAKELCGWLVFETEMEWAEQKLNPFQLGKKIAGYEIKSNKLTLNGRQDRYYFLHQFHDVFERYGECPKKSVQSVQSVLSKLNQQVT